MFFLLLFIIGIINVIIIKYKEQQEVNNQQQEEKQKLEQEKLKLEQQQQIDSLLQQLQKQNEPIDCVGSFDDWSECNIEKCDISNNINGIGKKNQKIYYQ